MTYLGLFGAPGFLLQAYRHPVPISIARQATIVAVWFTRRTSLQQFRIREVFTSISKVPEIMFCIPMQFLGMWATFSAIWDMFKPWNRSSQTRCPNPGTPGETLGALQTADVCKGYTGTLFGSHKVVGLSS